MIYFVCKVEKGLLIWEVPLPILRKGREETMEEKKSTYKGNTEARRRAAKKYSEKLDDIRLRGPAGSKENIKKYADAAGVSLNQYILDAVRMRMDQETPLP